MTRSSVGCVSNRVRGAGYYRGIYARIHPNIHLTIYPIIMLTLLLNDEDATRVGEAALDSGARDPLRRDRLACVLHLPPVHLEAERRLQDGNVLRTRQGRQGGEWEVRE